MPDSQQTKILLSYSVLFCELASNIRDLAYYSTNSDKDNTTISPTSKELQSILDSLQKINLAPLQTCVLSLQRDLTETQKKFKKK